MYTALPWGTRGTLHDIPRHTLLSGRQLEHRPGQSLWAALCTLACVLCGGWLALTSSGRAVRSYVVSRAHPTIPDCQIPRWACQLRQRHRAQRWEDPSEWGSGPLSSSRAAANHRPPDQPIGAVEWSPGIALTPRLPDWGAQQGRSPVGWPTNNRQAGAVNPWAAMEGERGSVSTTLGAGTDVFRPRWVQFASASGQPANPSGPATWNDNIRAQYGTSTQAPAGSQFGRYGHAAFQDREAQRPQAVRPSRDANGESTNFIYRKLREQGRRFDPDSIYAALVRTSPRAHVVLGFALDMVEEDRIPATITTMRFINVGKIGQTRKIGKSKQHDASPDSLADTSFYNRVLAGLARNGAAEEAKEVFGMMKGNAVPPDTTTFHMLLTACKNARRPEEALAIYDAMLKAGVPPDGEVYSSVMSAVAAASGWPSAVKFFEEMKRKEPDMATAAYNSIIATLGEYGQLKQALAYHQEMQAKGLRADLSTFVALMGGYEKAGQADMVPPLFLSMQRAQVLPNVAIFASAIAAYALSPRPEMALRVYADMQALAVPLNDKAYRGMMTAYTHMQKLDKALEIFDTMVDHGVPPSAETFLIGMQAAHQLHKRDRIRTMHDMMRELRVLPDDRFTEVLQTIGLRK
eukprot:GGOE01054185.1.p1 GENE.GGOE01054185.1~~GGOE01054185.1.p1  ORF type:complete len:633 (-),score=137.78 GGOE01054185.1:1114-3012(-)